MRTTAPTMLIGAATTAVVGVVTGDGWPGFVIGAALALALWLMLHFGSYARPDGARTVRAREFLLASVVGTLLGGAMFFASDDNAAFWAPGFILGGALVPSTSAVLRRDEQP